MSERRQIKVRLAEQCLDQMGSWCEKNGQPLAIAIEVAWAHYQQSQDRKKPK